MKKIGILSGTFDPIHIGHITFARDAAKKFDLEKIVFLPERQPRNKKAVTDFKHRTNMLKIAVKPFEFLEILELPDLYFTIEQTIPELQKHFPGAKISLLLGSDIARSMDKWSGLNLLAKNASLIIGLRHNDSQEELQKLLSQTEPSLTVRFSKTRYPEITSTQARKKAVDQLDPSIQKYIKRNKLYNLEY